MMSKIETFQVESASRRSVRELVDSFQKQQNENNKKTANLEEKISGLQKKFEDVNLLLSKQQKQLLEVKQLDSAVKQVQINMDSASA